MDIYEEFRDLVIALEARGIDYAVAGALALAVHGVPRATSDIDLLVCPEDVDRIRQTARERGFTIEAPPIRFRDGLEVRRVNKIDGEEMLSLDLLLVNPNLEGVWTSRQTVESEFGAVRVVSREALIQMKAWAGRSRDVADIERLRELDR